jgi:hypothetical protein
VYRGRVQCGVDEMWDSVQGRGAVWRRDKRVYKAKLFCGFSGDNDVAWKICRTV